MEENNFVGPVSAIIRPKSQKYGVLSTNFDLGDESENGNNNPSLKQILINKHTEASRGDIKGHSPLEYLLGF